eukprot:11943013-Prorocentrum_lima.AAC.1
MCSVMRWQEIAMDVGRHFDSLMPGANSRMPGAGRRRVQSCRTALCTHTTISSAHLPSCLS